MNLFITSEQFIYFSWNFQEMKFKYGGNQFWFRLDEILILNMHKLRLIA